MTRRNQYRLYLGSPAWKEHRDYALERTSGFCQFCGEIATQVHHVKYPKCFGEEHPHSLIPVCERCHKISHGIQEMKELTDVTRMNELSPQGVRLNYLLSSGRVYASAKSWARALQMPDVLYVWFEQGLARTAMFKKNVSGGAYEMSYQDTPVYRWRVVAEILRSFDREWHNTKYKNRPKSEQREIDQFHENYDRLVEWGDDLQEKAMSAMLNVQTKPSATVSPENLIEAMKQAVAPRLLAHDDKLQQHDVVIAEIKEAVPTLRKQEEFITVRQAISEQGRDPTVMPLYPNSRENLSGLAGQRLKDLRVPQGPKEIARVDGRSVSTEVNTYRRSDIYQVIDEIFTNKQGKLTF